jgi:hypothetical protein
VLTEKSSRDDEGHYYMIQRLRELPYKWPDWGTLERAEVVVRLRNEGLSLRKLAKIAGCSEGTLRNYDLLGRTRYYWRKAHIDNKISMRRLVQLASEERKRIRHQERRRATITSSISLPASKHDLLTWSCYQAINPVPEDQGQPV